MARLFRPLKPVLGCSRKINMSKFLLRKPKFPELALPSHLKPALRMVEEVFLQQDMQWLCLAVDTARRKGKITEQEGQELDPYIKKALGCSFLTSWYIKEGGKSHLWLDNLTYEDCRNLRIDWLDHLLKD